MSPRFIIKFVVPEEPTLEQVQMAVEAFEHENFLLIGKAEIDLLDLESNRVWRIDSSGIRETQAVRLIGPER